MEEFPDRNWGPIYQQGWSLMLQDKSVAGNGGNKSFRNNSLKGGEKPKDREVCWRYNKGECTFGQNCRFDHRCAHCSKSGHSINNCCKKEKDNKDKNVYHLSIKLINWLS